MKTIIKKIVKITISLILIFYVINVAKNFYLYFTYKHGDLALIKVEGQPDEIKGKWKGISDHWHGADEMRLINEFKFNSDSTGIYHEKIYSKRINGISSELYSWKSILPFDKNDYFEYQYRVLIDSIYITFFPDSNTRWQDTVYSKYKISNDSLYIDQCWPEDHRYTEEPCWTNPLSFKILDFKDLFIPYLY